MRRQRNQGAPFERYILQLGLDVEPQVRELQELHRLPGRVAVLQGERARLQVVHRLPREVHTRREGLRRAEQVQALAENRQRRQPVRRATLPG